MPMPSPSPSLAGAPRRPRKSKTAARGSPSPLRVLGEPPPWLFPSRDELLRLAAVVSIAAAAAFSCNLLYRRPKPFCDSSYPHDPLDSYDLCEPCPENGQCIDGQLECIHGFRISGNICIEDGLISQTAKKIVLLLGSYLFFFLLYTFCDKSCRFSMKSELLEARICGEHARVLCGEAGKILFQEADITKMVAEQLSKNSIGLSEDGIKIAKNRVLKSVWGLFETKLTYDSMEEFKCPEMVAELHRPLTCQVRQWIYRNIIFVVTSVILDCYTFYGAFIGDELSQRELSKYTSRCVTSLKIMP